MPTKTSTMRQEGDVGNSTTPTRLRRGPAVSLSEAIREALKTLGDPDAPASKVKEIVLTSHPALAWMTENERNWNSYVSQNRDKAAEEMAVERRKTKRGRRTQVSLSEAIRAALKKLGDPDAPASEVKDIVVALIHHSYR